MTLNITIPVEAFTRLVEIDEYARAHGDTRREAIIKLVNNALSRRDVQNVITLDKKLRAVRAEKAERDDAEQEGPGDENADQDPVTAAKARLAAAVDRQAKAAAAVTAAQTDLDAERRRTTKKKAFRDRLLTSWTPIIAEINAATGLYWELESNGGSCVALTAQMGGVKVRVTDYLSSTLSPAGEQPITVGFYLPSAPWDGASHSWVNVRDVVGIDLYAPAICFAVSDYLDGFRSKVGHEESVQAWLAR